MREETAEERITALEEEVQALCQESETQKQVNQELRSDVLALRQHLGLSRSGDLWQTLKRQASRGK